MDESKEKLTRLERMEKFEGKYIGPLIDLSNTIMYDGGAIAISFLQPELAWLMPIGKKVGGGLNKAVHMPATTIKKIKNFFKDVFENKNYDKLEALKPEIENMAKLGLNIIQMLKNGKSASQMNEKEGRQKAF